MPIQSCGRPSSLINICKTYRHCRWRGRFLCRLQALDGLASLFIFMLLLGEGGSMQSTICSVFRAVLSFSAPSPRGAYFCLQ